MNDYIFYENVYTPEEIDIFSNLCNQKDWNRIESTENFDLGDRYWIPVNIKHDTGKLIDSYLNYIIEPSACQLENHIDFSGGYTAEAKITKYGKGDQYFWHCDSFVSIPNKNYQREISSITYLNDDFEGGETEFYPNHIITPVKGKTLIFPSNWCFIHRGRPVISGEKYILVQHFWV
jgi:Rps23 Pro-64 3,4-dihydroxylase Tpa1-like proline 4-hydroxylase